MIIILKRTTTQEEKNQLIENIKTMGLTVKDAGSEERMVLGLIGDTAKIDITHMQAHHNVEKVMKVQEPFKLASRAFHPKNSILKIEGHEIGGGNLTIIAGPCSVESREQILTIAQSVKAAGAHILRGGAFKPRTSPYSFQGLGEKGLKLLKEAKELTGLPIITEAMSTEDFDLVESYTDIIQIGARNMQNFSLLKKAGKAKKPIMLKRGMSATIEEFLMSAEYIMASGNSQIVLCERGIRTFENYTRNTLDLATVIAVKELSHLPIIIDPSHATGKWHMVEPMSRAAVAVGADGIMVEVHNNPEKALSDGQQSLKPERFEKLVVSVGKVSDAIKDMVNYNGN
ncbi:MAG: 3-deoxy-7-phosphoheptulonate synthase [Alkaliphilus sp.]|nr:3-deoxy-7-phosphoheptulonate synthase [Alkaliphilus sp. AH-315-G20]MBN4067628.1 3-deoxy-7-phosphoheptulonate synthase [Alkaliphilus transvaalensis]PHS34876.1 MAG: 3-deoxy-7-phosphoheptulonate synthase [Alkaliphilus sp.]